MDNELIGRRGWLQGVGVAGGLAVTGLVATAGPAAAGDDDQRDDGLSGSWMVDVVTDTGEESRSVLSLADGDVAIVHDIQPAGPPWTGTWDDRRGNEFRATLWTGFPGEDGPGSGGPTARLRLKGERRRGRLSGTFTANIMAPDGTQIEAFGGTFSGPRIEA